MAFFGPLESSVTKFPDLESNGSIGSNGSKSTSGQVPAATRRGPAETVLTVEALGSSGGQGKLGNSSSPWESLQIDALTIQTVGSSSGSGEALDALGSSGSPRGRAILESAVCAVCAVCVVRAVCAVCVCVCVPVEWPCANEMIGKVLPLCAFN